MFLAVALHAQGAERTSAVQGMVSVTPSCPGPQKVGQEPCTSPLAEARLLLQPQGPATGGQTFRFVANANGRFSQKVPPGRYVLKVEVEGQYPRCPDTRLRVTSAKRTVANVRCDSGMR